MRQGNYHEEYAIELRHLNFPQICKFSENGKSVAAQFNPFPTADSD